MKGYFTNNLNIIYYNKKFDTIFNFNREFVLTMKLYDLMN